MKLDLDEYVMTHKDDVQIKGKSINRELSWLQFNNRVLSCAINSSIPLNERMKFLGISCSNLDEFISVRLSDVLKHKDTQPYKKIIKGVISCMDTQSIIYEKMLESHLSKKDLKITGVKDLDKKEKNDLRKIFSNHIFSLLTPINIGSTNEIPNFYSGQNCIAVTIKHGNGETLNIIPINKNIKPYYVINNKMIMIEDIIIHFLNRLFINKEITSKGYFRVIKDADFILEHNTDKFILDRMEETLHARNMAKPLFLQISRDTDKRLKNLLINLFNIDKDLIHNKAILLDYSRFKSFDLLGAKYSYKPFIPVEYEALEDEYSIFSAIKKKDILLQHPYDSYMTVVKFIDHASRDPKVLAIKQTLYRVSSEDSPIVEALCRAARNGKHVSVLIEIKARFDEDQNIRLIDKLKNSGVNVLLGLEYLKTHCKMCVVARREDNDDIKLYSHIATGNYNEKTAKIYTDISYMTGKQKIGLDLLNIFNILSGVSTPDENLLKVLYAPVNLRKTLIKNIDNEINNVKKGGKGYIFLKLNSINDPIVINKLYEAADKGVEIYIICRGITSIVAKKNIYIKSIVGRFLEHSRIYYFYNNNKPLYYISSADLLTRNLDKRVELMLPINDNDCINKLDKIISIMKKDEWNSYEMREDGQYIKLKGDFNCHQFFIENIEKISTIKIPKKKK